MKLRRPDGALAVSVIVHIIVTIAVLHAIVAPRNFGLIFRTPVAATPPAEQIRFVVPPPAGPTAPAQAATPRPIAPPAAPAAAAPPRLVAPEVVPDRIPPPSGVETRVDSGRGVAGAAGDPGARGVSVAPVFTDPRIFAPPPVDYIPPAKTHAEQLQDQVASAIKRHQDSVFVANAGRRDPTDWTKEIDGRKYGIDPQWIHVGKFRIPTALLALIPMGNVQGNPTLMAREARINEMRGEIAAQVALDMNTRDERKRIQERMDRERAARLRAQAAAKKAPPPARQ